MTTHDPVNWCLQGFFPLTNTLVTFTITTHLPPPPHPQHTQMPKPTATPTPYDLHALFSVLWTSVCRAFVLSTSLATKHDDQHMTRPQWVQMADSTTRSVHNHLHTLYGAYKFFFPTFSLDSRQLQRQPTNQCMMHQRHVQTAKSMAMPAHCHIHPRPKTPPGTDLRLPWPHRIPTKQERNRIRNAHLQCICLHADIQLHQLQMAWQQVQHVQGYFLKQILHRNYSDWFVFAVLGVRWVLMSAFRDWGPDPYCLHWWLCLPSEQ